LTLIVGFTGAVMRIAYTSFDCYQSVALVKVELAHRGSIGGIVAVFFRTASFAASHQWIGVPGTACSSIHPWSAISRRGTAGSIWRVSGGRVEAQRLAWDREQSSSYQTSSPRFLPP
jgi:hypothetical protein